MGWEEEVMVEDKAVEGLGIEGEVEVEMAEMAPVVAVGCNRRATRVVRYRGRKNHS